MNDELADEDSAGPGAGVRICTESDVAAQYAQHHQWLRDTARRRFPSQTPDLLDDAVGVVFVRLLNQVDKGKLTDKGDRWRAYLRRMVLNSCVDLIRRDVRFRNVSSTDDPEIPHIIDHDPLGDEVADDDLRRRRQPKLNEAVAKLSERQVSILQYVMEGWTNKQIGERLGISGQAVGQQLKTIMNRLHEEVTKDE